MTIAKLAKVLARAASDNEAEAVRALHLAKRMLEGMGLDFVDVANLMTEAEGAADSTEIDDLNTRLLEFRREIRRLKAENRRLRSGTPNATVNTPLALAEAEKHLSVEVEARKRAEAANRELAQCILQMEQEKQEAAEQISRQETEQQAASDEIQHLSREIRQLNAGTKRLNNELEHSERERYRLTALMRQLSLGRGRQSAHSRGPRPRAHCQYTLFDFST